MQGTFVQLEFLNRSSSFLPLASSGDKSAHRSVVTSGYALLVGGRYSLM